LERISGDSLWVRVGSSDGTLVSIERADIHRLEISDGRKRNPGKGALWGAGVGLGLGVLAAATLDDCTVGTRWYRFDLCEGQEDVFILGSIAAGAAWGAVIGLLIKSERWVTVPPASLTLGRDAGRLSLGVEVRLGHRPGPRGGARRRRPSVFNACRGHSQTANGRFPSGDKKRRQ
jgi:hypothetical protein